MELSDGKPYTDNEDLQFYVEKAINWDEIARLTEVNYSLPEGFKTAEEAKEFYFEVLEMVGNFVADEIAPVAHHMDANPLKLVDGEVEGSKEYDAIREPSRDGTSWAVPPSRVWGNERATDGVYAQCRIVRPS